MPSIIFDFDGTLIDSRTRLYSLFCRLVPEASLSYDEYWEIKMEGIGHKQILNELNLSDKVQFSSFQIQWMELIESNQYLRLDTPIPEVDNILRKLDTYGIKVELLTARQNPDKVHEQLQKWKWDKYLENVLVTQQKESKKDMIKGFTTNKEIIAMVGDTGYDVITANEMGIHSIGVLSGFHSKETLMKYKPNEIIKDISCIFNTYALKDYTSV